MSRWPDLDQVGPRDAASRGALSHVLGVDVVPSLARSCARLVFPAAVCAKDSTNVKRSGIL